MTSGVQSTFAARSGEARSPDRNRLLTRATKSFAADMSGMAAANKRVAVRAKLMGMRRGETDLRLFFTGPRLLMVEMKTMDGVLSAEHKKRHALLRTMGFDVRVVWADCPADALGQVEAILEDYLTPPV